MVNCSIKMYSKVDGPWMLKLIFAKYSWAVQFHRAENISLPKPINRKIKNFSKASFLLKEFFFWSFSRWNFLLNLTYVVSESIIKNKIQYFNSQISALLSFVLEQTAPNGTIFDRTIDKTPILIIFENFSETINNLQKSSIVIAKEVR